MKKEIATFISLLQALQEIDSEFPLQYAICLGHIALNEGLSLTDLSRKSGMPLSTVSRTIGALSDQRRYGTAYGLVNAVVSNRERRRKELYLTRRGHSLIRSLQQKLALSSAKTEQDDCANSSSVVI